jgi:hypothetical protein
MSFASIAIKTSIPGTVPAATSGAITLSTIEDENWLQIIGDASAGSGSLYLLRWNPDLSVWHPYMKDKPIAVDSSAFDGLFSAYYPFPKGDESFVLYDPTGTITATASAARTGSPLVAPTPASGGAMSGGATEAKQDAGNASLASINTKLTAPLSATVTGTAASGAAVSGNPVLVAGSNAGTARTISVDASGQQVVVGPGTAGSASGGVLSVQGVASMTPVQVSQATASNLNAQVVGAGASGAAVSGNPVLIAGTDGTNARTLSTDTSGRQRNAGATVFAYITAAGTTTVKSSAGILRAVHITAAFSAGSLTLYNANGTASNPIAGFGSGVTQSFLFNLECSNGITVVTGASFNGQVTVVVD